MEIRTPGLQYPKLARYQLRYTSKLIFFFGFENLPGFFTNLFLAKIWCGISTSHETRTRSVIIALLSTKGLTKENSFRNLLYYYTKVEAVCQGVNWCLISYFIVVRKYRKRKQLFTINSLDKCSAKWKKFEKRCLKLNFCEKSLILLEKVLKKSKFNPILGIRWAKYRNFSFLYRESLFFAVLGFGRRFWDRKQQKIKNK